MFSPKGFVYNVPSGKHGTYHGNSQASFASRHELEACRRIPVIHAFCFVGMFRFHGLPVSLWLILSKIPASSNILMVMVNIQSSCQLATLTRWSVRLEVSKGA